MTDSTDPTTPITKLYSVFAGGTVGEIGKPAGAVSPEHSILKQLTQGKIKMLQRWQLSETSNPDWPGDSNDPEKYACPGPDEYAPIP